MGFESSSMNDNATEHCTGVVGGCPQGRGDRDGRRAGLGQVGYSELEDAVLVPARIDISVGIDREVGDGEAGHPGDGEVRGRRKRRLRTAQRDLGGGEEIEVA